MSRLLKVTLQRRVMPFSQGATYLNLPYNHKLIFFIVPSKVSELQVGRGWQRLFFLSYALLLREGPEGC